jgi:hypothetical protein
MKSDVSTSTNFLEECDYVCARSYVRVCVYVCMYVRMYVHAFFFSIQLFVRGEAAGA